MMKREKENKAASSYVDFLESKRQLGGNHGFEPIEIPSYLFDFQTALVVVILIHTRAVATMNRVNTYDTRASSSN